MTGSNPITTVVAATMVRAKMKTGRSTRTASVSSRGSAKRPERKERVDQAEGHQHSKGGSGRDGQHRLCERLQAEPAPRRTERDSNGSLARSGSVAAHEQVRGVRAGRTKQESDRRQ
jgi:hypothetical protein